MLTHLILEFEDGGNAALAARIVDAEAADFHWAVRMDARWIGTVETLEGEAEATDCVMIIGYLNSGWFVANAVIDSAGQPDRMRGLGSFASAWDAYEAVTADN